MISSTRFILAAFLLPASLALAAPQYTIQQIGDFDFIPNSINNFGQVAGCIDPYPKAAFWSGGTTTPLPTPTMQYSTVFAINNSGRLVGYGLDNQNQEQSFVSESSGGFINYAVPAGQSAFLSTINNAGAFAGEMGPNDGSGPLLATIWATPQHFTPLPSLGTGESRVLALNDLGQAVGTSGNSYQDFYPLNPDAQYGLEHAAMWNNGQVIDLTPNTHYSEAESINNHGQIVGWTGDYDPVIDTPYLPFLWDPLTGLQMLPYLRRGASPSAINDTGQIVGSIINDRSGSSLAALWVNDTIYDLNDVLPANSGWILEYATDINDPGQIVGYGTYNGQQEGFILIPATIPEPSTLLLFLPAILFYRTRRT